MDPRDQLDDLLAEGRLAAPARERMFDRIYAASAGRARRRWAAMLVPALAAVALLVAWPRRAEIKTALVGLG